MEILPKTCIILKISSAFDKRENFRLEAIEKKSQRKVKVHIEFEPDEYFTDQQGRKWKRVNE